MAAPPLHAKPHSRPATRRAKPREPAVAVLAAVLVAIGGPGAAQSLLVVEDPTERVAYRDTYTFADGFTGSDALPPARFTDDPRLTEAVPRDGPNLAYASARTALGARIGDATFEYFYRRDWWLEGSAGAVRFHELARADALVASGQNLDIDYRWQGFDADGLRFTGAGRLALWRPRDTVVGLSISVLRLQQVRRESAHGTFASDGSTGSLRAEREIWYSGFSPAAHDGLTGFRPTTPREPASYGYGTTLDLGLRHDLGGAGSVRFVVSDAYSRLKWNRVPHLTQQVAIAGATSDAGLSAAAPGVIEQASYDDLNFRLPAKVLFGFELTPRHRWRFYGEHIWYRDEGFLLGGFGYRFSDAFGLRADYDLRWKTIGLTMTYRRMVLGLRADSLSPRNARAGGGTLRLAVDF
jgi:hypothetical protein